MKLKTMDSLRLDYKRTFTHAKGSVMWENFPRYFSYNTTSG